MERQRDELVMTVWLARQPSTIGKYALEIRQLKRYCEECKLNLSLPVDSEMAIKFLLHRKSSTFSYASVKSAFHALQWINSFVPGLNDANDPLNDRMLSKVLENAQRNCPAVKNQKLPLTADMVKNLIIKLSPKFKFEEYRDVLAISLAYTLLLRHDEFSKICCDHLTDSEKGVKVFIPCSKTDQFRGGNTVFLSNQHSGVSVFKLLKNYMRNLDLNFGDKKFLFPYIDSRAKNPTLDWNKPLAYSQYLLIFKFRVASLGLDPTFYGTHSARAGGATTLAEHVSTFELLLAGRWRDERSIRSYVEVKEDRRWQINNHLSIF